MKMNQLKIIPLEQVDGELVGGKAKGLAKLIKCGLNVPLGFVITGDFSKLSEDLIEKYHKKYIGDSPVAVRSSALDEDTDKFSNAGQYLTVLNVGGMQGVKNAIYKCVESIQNKKALAYKQSLSQSKENQMAVIVQKMVKATKAGVVFTRDPFGRNKHIIINAVEGLGEELVSGKKQAYEYIVDRNSAVIAINQANNKPLLSNTEIKILVEGALKAEKYFNKPLDLEWAIDKDGKLYWLQARTITTLNQVTMNELDTPVPEDNNRFYTRANVGEMLPGAVTPLSISIFAEAIDIGLRWMYQKVGAIKKSEEPRFVCNFYNHLFFDVTNMYKIIEKVLGASKESFDLNIFGDIIDSIPRPKRSNFFIRTINGIKYMLFVNGYKQALKKLRALSENFTIDTTGTADEIYTRIDQSVDTLFYAYYLHYQVSANSGAMNGALTAFLGDGKFTKEALSKAALLLSDISDIESANILESLEEIAQVIIKDQELFAQYVQIRDSPDKFLKWIKSGRAKEARTLFNNFIARHGHRAIREAELREKDWKTDPSQPIKNIMALIEKHTKMNLNEDSQLKAKKDHIRDISVGLSFKGLKGKIFSSIYEKAKQGMRNRELSKSMTIKVQSHFREAYRILAKRMVKEQLLSDEDLIYFLKHEEIGDLIKNKNLELVSLAQQRKKLFVQQQSLQFPEITIGKPKPVDITVLETNGKEQLHGIPVSRGKVKAKIRVVRSLEDAEKLQPNEIMVAEFTDIGWSPYYSIISGLITEIGGSLSHGAIVAREYGLPFVSGITNATKILKTGQEVFLDADKGIVTILSR